MNIYLKSMTIGLSLIAGSQAMDAPEPMDVESGNLILQGQETRELTPTEKKYVYKMWLLKQAGTKGSMNVLPVDVQNVISQTLHELSANPVLDGELVYTGTGKENRFKIRDLIKNGGCLDLSNLECYGQDPWIDLPISYQNPSNYLSITTNPEAFFRISNRPNLIILIAPKFLIEEKIETTTKTFQPIMTNWKEEQAPIGIFCRSECWNDPQCFLYLTSDDLSTISKYNLYENCLDRSKIVRDPLPKLIYFFTNYLAQGGQHIKFIFDKKIGK